MTDGAWGSADPYERFMGRWSRLLAAEVVGRLRPPTGLRWLDVGCGTGALSEALLDGADPDSVVGVDTSAEYVAATSARLNDSRATLLVGSADELPLPDASVDRAVSGLVLNFVPDAMGALREMRRVVVPGGGVASYVWDYADGMQMLRLFWDAVIAEDPAAASLDEGARFAICQPGGLERCFADAGLDSVRAETVEISTVFDGFDDYWQPFLGAQGPASVYVLGLTAGARESLRARLQSTLPVGTDGRIRLTARAWAASGVSG